MTWESVRTDLQAVLDRVRPAGVEARIGCLVRQRPFIGPGSGPLADALAFAHRLVRNEEIEGNVDRGAQAFVTDAVDMTAAGIESVVYGPAEWHHAPDAFVDVDEMVDASRVYLAAAIRLMEGGAAGKR